jgi:hypothetical protein
MKTNKIQLVIFLVLLTFGFLGINLSHPCYAQKPLGTLTILYSNNINGEVDPCPT